jgi:hypothetical protein
MEAGWLLAVMLAPLFFNVYSSRVFEPDKIALIRSLALVMLAAWLIKLISEGGPRFENARTRGLVSLRDWLRVPMLVPVAAFALIYLLATIFSVAPNISIFGSYQRLQGTFTTFSYLVIFAAIVGNLRQRAQIERLFTVVIVTSLPISIYGILQRYRLDPLPWGGETVDRVTGHMGNAIFLAAYLIMAALLTLGRVVAAFRAVMTEAENLTLNTVRAALYVFIFAVNLVAIWFTQSRGPQLGLLAGLFFFFVLLALHYRVRWLALTTVGLAAALFAFLIALNIPNGPFENLKTIQGLGRLANMFDELEGRTGTGQVRVLIWSGVVDMVQPHAPILQPDGTPDPWNPIRPLIGYGPEAMHVAYNRFYPPELGQIEARNASPDRSHNETFDALAFTGGLGLLAYLALFTALFYYNLKWLGLISSARQRNIFLAFMLGGGALGAVGMVMWQGPEMFGIGLPFGMLAGLILFLTLFVALFPSPETQQAIQSVESWRAVALISLFAAIIAHFAEIHFGIAIVSTRTHFWVYLGALWVLGWLYPALQPATANVAAASVTAGPGTPTPARASARRRRAEAARASAIDLPQPIGVTLGLLSALLITLGFNFITNSARSPDIGVIIGNSLTLVNTPQGARPSFGILGVILFTWLAGGVLSYLEEKREGRGAIRWGELAAGLGLSFLVGILAWILHANTLAQSATYQLRGTTPEEVGRSALELVSLLGAALTLYYALMLVTLLGWAFALRDSAAGYRAGQQRSGLAWLGYLGLPLLAPILSVTLNLQVIQADVVYKTGLQADDQGQPVVSIPLFNRTLELAPSQDFYYLFLGRAYLNASNTVPADQRDALFATGESKLKDARAINPLNTDHTANLARLNKQWAIISTSEEARRQHAEASDKYYEEAVRLSPNNAGLWNEWALLKFEVLGDLAQAQAKLDQSLALDTTFDQTYQFQGDLYAIQARQATDPAVQQEFYAKAVEAYQKGVAAAERRNSSMLGIRLGLANVYVTTNQLQPAIEQYLAVAQLNAGSNQWKVLQALGELFRQTGDLAQARRYGEEALKAAPEANKADIQNWLNALPK